MANWAIVIGVDKYWRPEACLKGAVRDALHIRDWLLQENGGGVPHQNLTLLLAPDKVTPPPGLNWKPADRETIVDAIERLFDRSALKGERFFFHFSGHGLTVRNNFTNEWGIAPQDFNDIHTDKAFTVQSLFELFQATHFEEQFFFIDACRNLPFETEQRLGPYPRARKPARPTRPQYQMFATQPGVEAKEIRQPGNERGAFTSVLLDGLSGAGSAKRWDEQSGETPEYVVRWDSLFKFVEDKITSFHLAAASTPDGPLIQIPKQGGEHGSANPQLARFVPGTFERETLAVDLQPQIRDIADIEVVNMAERVDGKEHPLPSLPVTFKLEPRSYAVRAVARGYVSKRRPYEFVDLYEPKTVKLELESEGGGPPPGENGSPPSGAPPAPPAPTGPTPHEAVGPHSQASLSINSGDELAHLELADGSGRILASGRSPLRFELAPGFYRVRLISPEGDAVEELTGLLPGASEFITPSSPPPHGALLESIISRSGFETHSDHTISISEAVGPSASLRLSTVLALGAAAATEEDSPYGQRLKALGLSSFQQLTAPDCSSGAQLVLGAESSIPLTLRGAEFRCWRLDEHSPEGFERLVANPELEATASVAMCCDPGPYWLWLRLPGRSDLTMPIVVFPNRVSLLVLTFDAHGKADLHQYALQLPTMVSRAPADNRFLDPTFRGSRFAAMRRIELMQRLVANGRITPALPDVQLLLDNKWVDPIAGCLGGYLLLRTAKPAELRVPVENLTKFFGDLPDAHVLKGAYLESGPAESNANATNAYLGALDRGLPIFHDGLALLDAAIERLGIQHKSASWVRKVLKSVPAGSLWSSSPDPRVLDKPALKITSLAQKTAVTSPAYISAAKVTSPLIVPTAGPSIDSKFRFVLLAAQRAEQLMRGAKPKRYSGSRFSPTRVAMEEIASGLVQWGYGPRLAEESSLQSVEPYGEGRPYFYEATDEDRDNLPDRPLGAVP